MKTHQMKLNDRPFRDIKAGIKTVEIRLYDQKRKAIEIGDQIMFSCGDESISVVVTGLSRFATLVELFSSLGGVAAGWPALDSPVKMAQDMRKYYTAEEEVKYGVLGIHFKRM
ncbi:MAG: hypothetical protein UZ21_OP11001000267 [Microgenomates bacterium OLB22]|nr:MAG: hypothetical protein UZ21_OP11001000267 [Microgenomates bacterium OLB22]